jgi:hypothetical protein
MRIEHSMMEFFQPDDYRIVMDVMMRRYREYFQHELEPRHFFDAIFDPLSNMVGLTVEQFKSRRPDNTSRQLTMARIEVNQCLTHECTILHA